MSGEKVEEKGTAPAGKAVPRSRMVMNLAAAIVLCLALLVMLNYLAARHYARGDWTAGGFHELSDKSIKVLESLDRDVDVVVFISVSSSVYSDLKEILQRYPAHSTRIHVEFVDPDQNPVRFKSLQNKYNVRSGMVDEFTEMSEQVVVVRSGENQKFVSVEEMTELDYGEDFEYTGEAGIKGFKAEEAVTGAILSVVSTEKLTICFAEGHGELGASDWGEKGIGGAVEFLRRDNYEVDTFDMREKESLPKECAVVVLAGPERPLPADDVGKLEAYLAAGGNILAFLEPIIDGGDILPTGLDRLLEKVGIAPSNSLAVETDSKRLLVGGGVGIFVTPDYGDHAIVKPLGSFLSLWNLARPLTVIESSGASPSILVRTSGSSWGERDIGESDSDKGVEKDGDDLAGPLALGVASALPGKKGQAERTGGRVVVYGDVHLLSSGIVDDATWVDRELFVGAMAWLTERENLIAIPPKEPERYEADLTMSDIGVILVWVLVTIPGLVLLAGILVWLRRRR